MPQELVGGPLFVLHPGSPDALRRDVIGWGANAKGHGRNSNKTVDHANRASVAGFDAGAGRRRRARAGQWLRAPGRRCAACSRRPSGLSRLGASSERPHTWSILESTYPSRLRAQSSRRRSSSRASTKKSILVCYTLIKASCHPRSRPCSYAPLRLGLAIPSSSSTRDRRRDRPLLLPAFSPRAISNASHR